MAGRPIIERLSIAAQNGLKNGTAPDGPLTDDAVRGWLTENGPRALLKIPNIGPKTQEEICKACGFDPAEPREGPAPASAYTLRGTWRGSSPKMAHPARPGGRDLSGGLFCPVIDEVIPQKNRSVPKF